MLRSRRRRGTGQRGAVSDRGRSGSVLEPPALVACLDDVAVVGGHYVPALGSEQLVVVAERGNATDDDLDATREVNRAVFDEIGIVCGDVRIVEPGWLIKTTSGKISRADNARKYVESFGATESMD